MPRALTRLLILCVVLFMLAFALIAASVQAFPTDAERQARAAKAMAQAHAAQMWAEQADERAKAFTVFLWLLLLSLAATCAGVGFGVVRAVNLRSQALHAHPQTGLYPAVRDRGNWQVLNEPGAQHLAALPARPTAALARALLAPATPRAALPAEGTPPVTVFEPQAVDLVRRPHTILLGRTGSGKSNAAHALAQAIRERYPAEFVVCEPGGVTWAEQCHAADVRGIAEAIREVEAEMRRRQALLVEHDRQHVSQLPVPLPALVLLIEELEDVLDTLRLEHQASALAARIALRNIAREGRKAGVCLLAVTQVGKSDVLDTHIRHNAGALYLFPNAPQVGQALRLPPHVRLDRLQVGEAYEYHSGRIVRFPVVPRPLLPLSSVVAKRLPAPAPAATPLIPRGRAPTPEEAAAMREAFRRGETLTGICFRFYGYKDGYVFRYVKEAVQARSGGEHAEIEHRTAPTAGADVV